jgi:hypothetical protein
MPNILALQPDKHSGGLTGHQHHNSWQNEKRKLGNSDLEVSAIGGTYVSQARLIWTPTIPIPT